MAEEMEVPLEQTQEDLHHHAHHATEPWIGWVALSSALIAALAAVTVLQAGHYAEEANDSLLESFNGWNHYQAKSIKQMILSAKNDPTEKDTKNIERYEEEKKELEKEKLIKRIEK